MRSDLSTLDDPRRLGQVAQSAVGAATDERRLDRHPGGPGDRDGIADHRVRQGDQRSDIVEVSRRNYPIRGQME